jgi:flavin reductase (DIM6/NTAB) family NADH-FMN oxidoreductase RutF
MKQQVNAFDYAGHICESMKKGILLTTKTEEKVNTMTIGWGTIGIEWGRPVFVAYVRVGRHTRQMLDECGEFTVNIPYGEVDSKILGFCGTKSGRDTDKIAEMGLELVDSSIVNVPGIRQLPLTLECKVLCQKTQNIPMLPENIRSRYYPKGVDSSNPGSNEDFHIAYYGEIVNAYLIED